MSYLSGCKENSASRTDVCEMVGINVNSGKLRSGKRRLRKRVSEYFENEGGGPQS